MLLHDLIEDLRTDLADPEAVLFSNPTLSRCIKKAIFRLSSDLKLGLVVENDLIKPDVSSEIREILVVLAQIYACQVMRSATANAYSFSSGDKRVDKTSQPEHWAKLEADLQADYEKRLIQIRPNAEINLDSYIITPPGLTPVIYEQGLALEENT